MEYFLAVDIGGTTFNTGLFTKDLIQVEVAAKDKIRYYDSKNEIINEIIKQFEFLIENNNVNKKEIIGIGVASPGPLDSKKGIILNTPNLKMFQNYHITNDFNKKLKIDTFLENDANLFTLGEWYNYKKEDVVLGVTLGTGLGFGVVINGKLFTGGNGNALEYGHSPFKWGICEKNVCLNFIRNRSKDLYGEQVRPKIIEKYCREGDEKAKNIYNEFGNNLGIVLSHAVNMFDPNVIIIGGGLSKAFDCFKDSMLLSLDKHSYSFSKNSIEILESKLKESSIMRGACLMVKNVKGL